MILIDDGLDAMWEENINWKVLHPPSKEEEIMSRGTPPLDEVNLITSDDEDTMTFIEKTVLSVRSHSTIVDEQFHWLQNALATLLHYTYEAGELRWPYAHVNGRQNIPHLLVKMAKARSMHWRLDDKW